MSEVPFTYLMCGVVYENRHVDSTSFTGRGSTRAYSTAYGYGYDGDGDVNVFGDGDEYGDTNGEIDIGEYAVYTVKRVYGTLHIGDLELNACY